MDLDYRIPKNEPFLPERLWAMIGLFSAITLIISGWLPWWYDEIGHTLTLKGQPSRALVQYHNGYELKNSWFILAFGLVALILWVNYLRVSRHWLKSRFAVLLIAMLIAIFIGLSLVAILVGLNRLSIAVFSHRSSLSIGVYVFVGACAFQAASLIWLAWQRSNWKVMRKAP